MRPTSEITRMLQVYLHKNPPAPARDIANALQLGRNNTNVALCRLVDRGEAFVLETRKFSWSTRPLRVFTGQRQSDELHLQATLSTWLRT
jgi:hypothetical protein